MGLLRSLSWVGSVLLNYRQDEELSPELQADFEHEAVLLEAKYWEIQRNSQRLAAFNAKKALAKIYQPPHWMGPIQKARPLAPVRIGKRQKRKTAKVFDIARARKRA